VEGNTNRLLDLFDETGATATFFVLGWIARRYPSLVRQIAARGHEVASHGMEHRMLTEQSPETFQEDARDSKALLEDLSGGAILGFRAPSYSIGRSTLWAVDVLADAGYAYDSSVYPIRRKRYGYPEGPERPAILNGSKRTLPEFPLPTLSVGPWRVPVLAGAYLRLWPSWVSRFAAREHLRQHRPLVVNIHPWEIDPDQPTIGGARWRTWTHYTGLRRTQAVLREILSGARFRDVATRLRELGLLEGPGVRAGEAVS
jgi:polysaccharide deacetylase family protein (PEP-CTERM system associated)